MAHLRKGTLRRLVDEPLAVSDDAIAHLARCRRCRARRDLVTEDASRARGLLSAPRLPPDTDRAWAMFQSRCDGAPNVAAAAVTVSRPRRWRLMGVSVGAGTTVAGIGVLVAGVATAATLTTVFAPTKVAPVQINRGDLPTLAAMAGLDDAAVLGGFSSPTGSMGLSFGTIRWSSPGGGRSVATVGDAEAATGLRFTLPRTLPAGVGTTPSILVHRSVRATITFGTHAAPALQGSSLTVDLGPAISVEYGGATPDVGLPTLAIVAMKRPIATSTGATMSQLQAYLLSQPGLPPDLAQQIRLFGDLGTTLPVPTPPGAVETSTEIAGYPAVVLSDASDAASGVIWEDGGGTILTVAGLVDTKDVLGVAHQLG